jgi:hypothetical protein
MKDPTNSQLNMKGIATMSEMKGIATMSETQIFEPARFELIQGPTNWKDAAAGWSHWRIYIPKCTECGTVNTSYTIHGTESDARSLADDRSKDACDKCS